MNLDYDDQTAVSMLAALRECPASKRLDTLAAVCKAVIEGDLLHTWPDARVLLGEDKGESRCPTCGSDDPKADWVEGVYDPGDHCDDDWHGAVDACPTCASDDPKVRMDPLAATWDDGACPDAWHGGEVQ